MRAVICLLGTSFLVACAGAPPVPDIEVKLIDAKNEKVHYYLVPKARGEKAKYLRSERLSLLGLNKNFALDAKNYSILEGYMSELEDWAEAHCR